MLNIQHNLLAENANRQLGINTNKNVKITEKLSSGYKINRAADDAAGLAISEKMRRQVRGLNQGANNIKDGIGYVQTAEGALNEVHDMLQRINELAVQAANGTNTETDRAYIDSEVQALKREMDRIFETTTFNERRIWDYGPGEQLEYDTVDAVTFTSSDDYTYEEITNANYGVLALANQLEDEGYTKNAGYTVHANRSGIWVTWTGYDGKSYRTDTAKWDDLNINGGVCSFEMSDYFGEKTAANKLYTRDADGKYVPVFKKTVSFSVHEEAWAQRDKKDIIKSIDGAKMSSWVDVNMYVQNEHCTNISSTNSKPVYVSSSDLTYGAAYVSHVNGATNGYTFDGDNDSFLVPRSTLGNLEAPVNASDKFVFKFNMPGIGNVTATPNPEYSGYYSTDTDLGSRTYWWDWSGGREQDGTWNPQKYRSPYHFPVDGTLGSVQNALQAPHGLLAGGNGGNTYSGGRIYMRFDLIADNAFTYGDGISTKDIGYFSLAIDINQTKGTLNLTYDEMMAEINAALNTSTVLDFYNRNNDSGGIGGLDGKSAKIKVPIYPDGYVPYDDTQRFFVQAGAEAGQHIDIEYECLSLNKIGLTDTNTLTEEDAEYAIDEVKQALQKISEQRSDFGAYQNRLEHAYNINNNTSENTQSAESVIRDADIADMMMEYSINNILMQAGTSMLAQANQSNQTAVELLQ